MGFAQAPCKTAPAQSSFRPSTLPHRKLHWNYKFTSVTSVQNSQQQSTLILQHNIHVKSPTRDLQREEWIWRSKTNV
eukprot:3906538-Amphidinium_carterae.1